VAFYFRNAGSFKSERWLFSHGLCFLGRCERFNAKDELFAPQFSTFVPTRKEANVPNVNTLPGEDVFYLDSRVLPRENLAEVMREIRRISDGIEEDFGVQVEILEVHKASSSPTSADAPIVGILRDAIKQVYGAEATTVGIGGGTVGAFTRGPESQQSFGPGSRRQLTSPTNPVSSVTCWGTLS
jgi:acetylornithine deacetylase/succinyl-diaminopimelate desuccinylase-like protein